MSNAFEVYKLAFAHNEEELRLLWQRNSSFLVANSAFLVGVGVVRSSSGFSSLFAVLGLLLSLAWVESSRKSYLWNLYWIRELKRLEEGLDDCKIWTRAGSSEGRAQGRPSTKWSSTGLHLASIFAVAWAILAIHFSLQLIGV